MAPLALAAPLVAEIGLGSTVAAGVVGAAGALFSGFSNAAMYNYQAGIARLNAQIERQNANYAIGVGETQQQQQGLKTRAEIGQTKAIQGASGLDVGSGTAVEVRSSEALLGAADQETIRGKALKEAYNFDVKALQDDAQAKADSMAATNSEIAGGIGAFSSILGATGSFSSKWLQAQQMGIAIG